MVVRFSGVGTDEVGVRDAILLEVSFSSAEAVHR